MTDAPVAVAMPEASEDLAVPEALEPASATNPGVTPTDEAADSQAAAPSADEATSPSAGAPTPVDDAEPRNGRLATEEAPSPSSEPPAPTSTLGAYSTAAADLARFATVGMVNTAIFAGLLTATWFISDGWRYRASASWALAYALDIVITYTNHRLFTFRRATIDYRSGLWKTMLVYGSSLLWSTATIWMLTEPGPLSYPQASFMLFGATGLYNFYLIRRWAFALGPLTERHPELA